MSTDIFDDGLVHDHAWARDAGPARAAAFPKADVRHAQTPSTVFHDERMLHWDQRTP